MATSDLTTFLMVQHVGDILSRWDNDPSYRERVADLALAVWGSSNGGPVCTLGQIEEYRAHLVLERMVGGIGEGMFDRAMNMAEMAELRVILIARCN